MKQNSLPAWVQQQGKQRLLSTPSQLLHPRNTATVRLQGGGRTELARGGSKAAASPPTVNSSMDQESPRQCPGPHRLAPRGNAVVKGISDTEGLNHLCALSSRTTKN